VALTVVTAAATQRLTTRAAVKQALNNMSSSADDAFIDALIDRASAAIRSYCHRGFAREAYLETLPGYDDVFLTVRHTPVVAVSAITDSNASVYTDFAVGDASEGTVYRRLGWEWTAERRGGLTGGQRFPFFGQPMPRETPSFTVAYTAGYLLPPENLLAATTVSASATDNSFNDTAGGFPALLKAGDQVVSSGFTTAANVGRFVASGTPTVNKVIVTGGALVTEAAPTAGANIIVQTLPYDLEQAAIEAVKTWFAGRADDSNVVEKTVGPMSIRFKESQTTAEALPASCIGLLRPWVRMR
jgi:hypothetical protein